MLAGIALGWFVIANIFKETSPEQVVPKEKTEIVTTPEPKKQETKMFDCLKKDVWDKKEMDAVEELNGLYDAISTANRGKIYEYKDLIGEGYPNWDKLIEALERTKEPSFDFKWGKDGSITITEYISQLDKKHETTKKDNEKKSNVNKGSSATVSNSGSSNGGMSDEAN